jgi:hypothetical protein
MSGDLLSHVLEAVFQNDLINNLSANNTSPSEEMLTITVKFFINHDSLTPMASHDTLLLAGVNFGTDVKLGSMFRVILFFQHPVLSHSHIPEFYLNGRKSK